MPGGGGHLSYPVVGGVLVVIPHRGKTCLAGLGGGVRDRSVVLACAQAIEEIFDVSHALRRKLLVFSIKPCSVVIGMTLWALY
ncbi:hypothetical protein SBBP1_490037 [Burkholderiales bacterium]|nr:hypothetical protein SBBP1_490037 [Burkholderiales bacterium]